MWIQDSTVVSSAVVLPPHTRGGPHQTPSKRQIYCQTLILSEFMKMSLLLRVGGATARSRSVWEELPSRVFSLTASTLDVVEVWGVFQKQIMLAPTLYFHSNEFN